MNFLQRLISYLFAILLLGLLLSFVVFFIAILQKPQSQSYLLVNKSPGEVDELYFLDIQLENKDIVLVKLDAKAETRLSGGYGEYTLQALYPLLSLDKKSDKEIRANFSQATALPVGKVLSFESLALIQKESSLALLWQLLSKADSPLERWRLFRFLLRAPLLNFTIVSPEEYLSDYSQDRLRCTVAVINSTESSGLAAYFANIYEANRYRVVRVDSDDQTALDSSLLYVAQSDIACIKEAELAARFLPESKIEESEELSKRYRADIVIFLGRDVAP